MSAPISTLRLSVDPDSLDVFCSKLINRSRDIAKTHDALVTLEAFIVTFGKAAHGTKEYETVEEMIRAFAETSRQQLLDEKTDELLDALRHCRISALAAIHTPLSRDGFYQIFQDAVARLSDDEVRDVTKWSGQWLDEARRKAEEASGYPDALDFKKAGISIEQFQAMADVSHFLTGSGSDTR
jgi:hypothetical protein